MEMQHERQLSTDPSGLMRRAGKEKKSVDRTRMSLAGWPETSIGVPRTRLLIADVSSAMVGAAVEPTAHSLGPLKAGSTSCARQTSMLC